MPKQKPLPSPPAATPDFISLKEFLVRSALSYTMYRRLRRKGQTPTEYKLSAKTILFKEPEVVKWVKNPLRHQARPTA